MPEGIIDVSHVLGVGDDVTPGSDVCHNNFTVKRGFRPIRSPQIAARQQYSQYGQNNRSKILHVIHIYLW